MKKFLLAVLTVAFAACMACSALFVFADSETLYQADKVFTQNTAPITYNEDGSIVVGDGDGSNASDLWTNAGSYTFSTEPFSVQFKMNGAPATDGLRKDNYFFIQETDSSNVIWINVFLLKSGESYILHVNINIQDAKPMVDNYVLTRYDHASMADEPITVTYNSAELTASVSVGELFTENFDLTKDPSGADYQYTGELPTGDISLSLMNRAGGITVQKINGIGFEAPDIEEPFDIVPNINKDFMEDEENTASVEYTDSGILVSDGETPAETMQSARMNGGYAFEDVLEIVYSYNGLKPAENATSKTTYFTIMQKDDPSKQLKVKLFAYCTSDDPEAADYILHAEVFTGEEGSGEYFAQNQNLLWSCKNWEDFNIRVRYEAADRVLKLYNPDGAKYEVDLTKTVAGGDADVSALPVGTLRFETLVHWGGIYIERVNDQNFKINYADFDVSYTDKTDFFTDESEARVAYRNGGIYITNNDKTGIDHLTAEANPAYTYAGNMIFEFRYAGLQNYVPGVPLSIQKDVRITVADAEGREVSIRPFLYKNGNVYMLHINMSCAGVEGMMYENHYLNMEFTETQALDVVYYIKYDSVNMTMEIGIKNNYRTIDLSQRYNGTNNIGTFDVSKLPQGTLMLDSIDVQYGGIYLERINQYSFVVEDPAEPDPVDPEIVDYGIPETTYASSLTFDPEISYGDYAEDTVLTVSYAAQGEEEFSALTRGENGYEVEFADYGTYEFKFELVFDGVTLTAVRTVSYQPSMIGSLSDLYGVTSGTYTVVDEGLRFDSRDPSTADLAYGTAAYEVAGTSTVSFRMTNLMATSGGAEIHKQVWIDFSDGVNGVWCNIFAYSAPGTSGRFPAYVSVFTFKNGDKGTQNVVQANVPLGFYFDANGQIDPNVTVVVRYEPAKDIVSVGKEGETLQSFSLTARDIPRGAYSINTACNYGGFIMTELNGFSFANEEGAFEHPAPIIDEESFAQVYVQGDKFVLPKSAIYDIFDRMPSVEVSLKDPAGSAVALSEEVVNGLDSWTAELAQLGDYTLSISAGNAAEKTIDRDIVLTVIQEDTERPTMTFAEDAFSAYRQGSRENRFEVKLGTTIVLPMPTLADDSGLEVSLQITVTDPEGKTTILSGTEFTGDTIGTYGVEYIATDITGKETRAIYNFVVMLRWEEEEGGDPSEDEGGGCSGAVALEAAGTAVVALGAAAVILCKKRKNKN